MVKQYQQTVQRDQSSHYSVCRITKNHYQVDSQKSKMTYAVTKTIKSDTWSCQCHDFMTRLRRGYDDKQCNHIRCALEIRENKNELEAPRVPEPPRVCNTAHLQIL